MNSKLYKASNYDISDLYIIKQTGDVYKSNNPISSVVYMKTREWFHKTIPLHIRQRQAYYIPEL